MNKTERMNGIVLLLKEKGRVTAAALAGYFEVSERTIYRDIDGLSQLKIPIISYEGVGGGYEIAPDYFMPSIYLNYEESMALLMVLKLGESIKLPNLMVTYQLLKNKILNTLEEGQSASVQKMLERVTFYLSRIDPSFYVEGILIKILMALEGQRQLQIEYYAPKADQYTKRNVSIGELFFEDGGWYISGHCHLRNEKRTFRLDRIHDAKVLDSFAVVDKRQKSATDIYAVKEYTLKLSPALYRVILDNEYMRHHEVVAQDTFVYVELVTSLKSQIIKLVMCYPKEAILIAPKDIREEIVHLTENLMKEYLNPDK